MAAHGRQVDGIVMPAVVFVGRRRLRVFVDLRAGGDVAHPLAVTQLRVQGEPGAVVEHTLVRDRVIPTAGDVHPVGKPVLGIDSTVYVAFEDHPDRPPGVGFQ